MTTVTLALTAVAPTRVERALLLLSEQLSTVALTRMRRRAASAGLRDRRAAAADAQRDLAAQLRAGALPR
jgi:hypothetical protein